MKKQFIFSALFFVSLLSCDSPQKKTQKILSLEEVLNQFKNTQTLEEISSLSDSLINAKNTNPKEVYYTAATRAFSIKDYKQSDVYLSKAMNSKAKASPEMEVNILYLSGIIALKRNLNYQAVFNLNKAGELIFKNKVFNTFPQKSDILLINVAVHNMDMNFNETALKYINYATEINNEFKGGAVNNNIDVLKASIFSQPETLNSDSLNFYLNSSVSKDDPNYNYLKAQYFYNAKQFDSAEYHLNIIKEFQGDLSAFDNVNLLTCQTNQNKFVEANKTVSKIARQLKKESFSSLDSINYLENLTEYYVATNQKHQALANLEKYTELRNRFFRIENAKNTNELSTLLEIKNKEQQIESISKHAKKIGFTLEKRNQTLLIALLIILFVITLYAFNRIRSKNKRIKLEQTKMKLASANHELEMKLLKNQMNPHFIFNSLSAIQSNIRQNKNEKALNYLGQFSGLMRLTLESTRKQYSSLQEEIELAEKYILLQQLRKGNFDYIIQISESVQQDIDIIPFPALSLQPFIENSILHGFIDSNHKGMLEIKIDTEGDYLITEIIDNGVGLNQAKSLHSSQAISIIKERLNLLDKQDGTKSTLTIENRTDTNGVRVYLKVPVREV